MAAALAMLERGRHDFILDWIQRVAATNTEVGYPSAIQVVAALD